MGNFFPEELVEEVRLANDIVDIISGYVVLKKKGRNYSGLCPFHSEKTPSFMVSPDKQIFHCFGCGAGGNVVTFLMKKENLNFPEAMRMLAEKAGISLPENQDAAGGRKNQFRDRAYEINGLANEYFHKLLTDSDAGREALNYLLKRGTSREIIDQFKLGYSLTSWDDLLIYLKKKGIEERELAKLGLILARERGSGYYDRFRNRVMFPIMDIRGKVAGFGGRVMDDSLPKYLNSPETEVFSKSNLLFGLNYAIGAIRENDQVLVMEGYMDVLTAHQFGIKNAVASLGTALTREQGKLLMRYTHNVVISYDADQAGVAATDRGLEILQELGCRVNVLSIPDGKDPDEFIKKQGPEAFNALIKKANSLIEYKITKAMEKFDTTQAEGKMAVVSEILPNLKNMDSVIQKEDAISYIAGKIGLYPEYIRQEYEKFIQNSRKKLLNRDKLTKNSYNNTMSAVDKSKDEQISPPRKLTPREKAEKALFRLLFEDKTVLDQVRAEIGLDFFQNPEYIKVINVFSEKENGGHLPEPGKLLSYFDENENLKKMLTELILWEVPYENLNEAVDGYISTIKKIDADIRKEKLLQEISAAEKTGNIKLIEQLLVEYKNLF